jgi:uncharacterized protein (DUF1810 family)
LRPDVFRRVQRKPGTGKGVRNHFEARRGLREEENWSRAHLMTDEYHLQRFLEAQGHVYNAVLDELRAREKRSHWMWYIFPQITGLGHSGTAQRFAISSLEEAKAYLQHPVLGPRLRECTQLVLNVNGRSAEQIFGYPDNLKFRSCLTLFVTATTDNKIFKDALVKYFEGKPDQLTLDLLAHQPL